MIAEGRGKWNFKDKMVDCSMQEDDMKKGLYKFCTWQSSLTNNSGKGILDERLKTKHRGMKG